MSSTKPQGSHGLWKGQFSSVFFLCLSEDYASECHIAIDLENLSQVWLVYEVALVHDFSSPFSLHWLIRPSPLKPYLLGVNFKDYLRLPRKNRWSDGRSLGDRGRFCHGDVSSRFVHMHWDDSKNEWDIRLARNFILSLISNLVSWTLSDVILAPCSSSP